MIERAVSTFSLKRTLGRFVSSDNPAPGSRLSPAPAANGALALLDLPAALKQHGYDSVHICHFHLPSRTPGYLAQLRGALDEAGIVLDTLLVDDGDLVGSEADRVEAWIGEWLDTAATLGARRARVGAGRAAATPETVRASAERMKRLAVTHPNVRVVTENWLELTADAGTVLALRELTGDSVGLLIDLNNWHGPDNHRELEKIAPLAETCHAKCFFAGSEPDRDDFRTSLQILKDAGYQGPLALIYDGADDNEWSRLDDEWTIAQEVFG